ncbi:MAG: hypothetical protein ACOYKZ_05695 [Chlamydiia bacterium]
MRASILKLLLLERVLVESATCPLPITPNQELQGGVMGSAIERRLQAKRPSSPITAVFFLELLPKLI